MSSPVLSRDIEEVREKVERMKVNRGGREGEGVKRAREGVVRCYRWVLCSFPLFSTIGMSEWDW